MTAGGLGRLRDAHKVILGALAWVPMRSFPGHQLAAALLNKSGDGAPSSAQRPSSPCYFPRSQPGRVLPQLKTLLAPVTPCYQRSSRPFRPFSPQVPRPS